MCVGRGGAVGRSKNVGAGRAIGYFVIGVAKRVCDASNELFVQHQ
jgi:hypothetical protein